MSKLSALFAVSTLVACSAGGGGIDQTGNDQADLSAMGADGAEIDEAQVEALHPIGSDVARDDLLRVDLPETYVESLACSHLQWWNSYITYSHMSYGWHDTDLSVRSSTPVQLRHASKLLRHGVYGWGYMPEFVDLVTGKRFRFLHLRPQHQWATAVGHVYPAGYVVGLSGGDTRDTGLGVYSTGAHLCVQSLSPYRACFPAGRDACR